MKHTSAINICKLSVFLFALCTNLLAPLILPISKDFGLSLKDSGMMFFLFYAGSFLACALGSSITYRFGKRNVLGFCLIMMSALCLLISFSPTYLMIFGELFCLGFVTLLIQVQSTAIPSELSTDGAAASISSVQAFSALGACIGLLWSGSLVTLEINWRIAYLAFGILTVAATVLFFISRFPKLSRSENSGFNHITKLLKSPRRLPTLICLLLYAGAETAICSWLVTFLVKERSFSTLEGSMVTAVLWLSIFLGRLICSRFVKRFAVSTIILCLVPTVFLSIWLIPWVTGVTIWICALILGFALSGIWPLIASKLLDDGASDSSSTLSVIFLFSFFGNTFLPYIIGAIADFGSLQLAIMIDGCIFTVLFIIFWCIRKQYSPTSN